MSSTLLARLAVYIYIYIYLKPYWLSPHWHLSCPRESKVVIIFFKSLFMCPVNRPAEMLRHTHTQETWSQVLWRRPESLILASSWRLLRTLVKLRKIVWKCIMAVEMVSCSAVLMLLGILRGRLRGSTQWKLMAYAFFPISEFPGFRRLQRCSAMLSAMCLGWKQWTWTSACHESVMKQRCTAFRLREIWPRCWTNDHWKGWLQRAEQSDMSPQLLGVTCWSSMKFNCWTLLKCHKCPKLWFFAAVTCDFP